MAEKAAYFSSDDRAAAAREARLSDAAGNEPCPECESGVVMQIGPQCRETGDVPYACSEYCGWSS